MTEDPDGTPTMYISRSTEAPYTAVVDNTDKHVTVFQTTKRKILRVSWTAKKINEWVLNKAGVKRELLNIVKARKLWSHRQETRELPEERYNARNNARCTQATKTTHGLDGQHPRRGQDSPWK